MLQTNPWWVEARSRRRRSSTSDCYRRARDGLKRQNDDRMGRVETRYRRLLDGLERGDYPNERQHRVITDGLVMG